MVKALKRIVAFVLTLSLLLTANINVLAAREEYICELRLVYADSYNEAKQILADTDFDDYEILNKNLNEDTGNTGVWLAYKTTDDIEDAITDMAVIQMAGGYKLGNYEEMIEDSYEEYLKMGDIYLEAIDYFQKAYEAGNFLANAAYRQLNFYNVVSEGIPKNEIPDFEGEGLGDIFIEGIDRTDLATMFFEGNVYALKNVRSLLAMGVSYNADGMTYLQKVADQAAKVNAGEIAYDEDELDELAELIAPTILVIKDNLHELQANESGLNYADKDVTEEELDFAESKAVADMLRDVKYLDGKTLYEFCYNYETNTDDYSALYPLAAALNDGQRALTKVAHYYDVVRYSLPFFPEEYITAEIDEMEELYGENPFNVYAGVDRTIYDGSFALTTDAYRADVYGEGGIGDALFGGDRWKFTAINLSAGALGAGIFIGAIVKRGAETAAVAPAAEAVEAATNATAVLKESLDQALEQTVSSFKSEVAMTINGYSTTVSTYADALDKILVNYNISTPAAISKATAFEKYQMLMTSGNQDALNTGLVSRLNENIYYYSEGDFMSWDAYQKTIDAGTATGTASHVASTALFIVGGALMLYSAISMALTVYNYYNPSYEDIPLALVDMIESIDGDRYIKYDAVLEVEPREKEKFIAGDLNAYEGQRWNALYYTKSYEAGKPLLADEFYVSNSNNKPRSGYTPVHRFGEIVCYDLNRYNFDDDHSIYLSVKQSKNDKSAVANVPTVVGSIFAESLWVLFSGVGALFGVGGTLGAQSLAKKKTKKDENA